jgi:hypothetical protein
VCLDGRGVARVGLEGLERRDALGGAGEGRPLVHEQAQGPGDGPGGAGAGTDLDTIMPACPPGGAQCPVTSIAFDGGGGQSEPAGEPSARGVVPPVTCVALLGVARGLELGDEGPAGPESEQGLVRR